MYKIVCKKELNSAVTYMEIEAPFVARKAKAGQFIIFRVDEKSERVPRMVSGVLSDDVLAIGPCPMMKFGSKTTEPFGVKTIVSLNPIMVDGTGMCGGCRVTVGGEVKFACVDGPDFDGHLVDYDELMNRNGVYREREAETRKTHVCRMQTLGEELIK